MPSPSPAYRNFANITLLALVAAAPFRGPNWSLTVPPDATPLTSEELALFNSFPHPPNSPGFVFTHGWHLPGPGSIQPYLVVQRTPVPFRNASVADLEKALGTSFKKEIDDNKGYLRQNGINVGEIATPRYDANRQRVTLMLDLKTQAGPLKGVCFIHPGANEMTQLNFYCTPDTLEENLRVFNSIADSYQYDPDSVWVPKGNLLHNVPSGAIIGGTIGAGIGGVVAIIKKRRKNGKA